MKGPEQANLWRHKVDQWLLKMGMRGEEVKKGGLEGDDMKNGNILKFIVIMVAQLGIQ